jgi:hypothetical protein
MTIAFYMDHNVHGAIVAALRDAGIDVLTAYEDRFHAVDDARLLDRSTALNRILFTQDEDFFALAAQRQADGIRFCSILYAHPLQVPVGQCVRSLLFFARAATPPDLNSHLFRLPF